MSLKAALLNLRAVLYPEYAHKRKLKYLNAVLGPGVVIYPEAKLLNNTGDKTKIRIGKDSHIVGILQVFDNCGEIQIGESCFIGDNTRLLSAARIILGNNVQLAHNINIFDSNIHSLNPVERRIEFQTNLTIGQKKLHDLKEREVVLDDNVWIGANCSILKGVRIGANTVVGAGSVVVKDLPANVVAVGNPAQVVKQISFNI